MEEGIGAIWAILMVIFAVASSIANRKKRQQQAQRNQNGPARPAAQPQQPAPQAAPAQPFRSALNAQAAEHAAVALETHMHTPYEQMGQEGVGTEGIDCCHEYMLTDHAAPEQESILQLNEGNEKERAQALLQGVIFSEILGRRNPRRYGGQKA